MVTVRLPNMGCTAVRGETKPVAEHRVADVEWRQRGEEVTTDVRREVELPLSFSSTFIAENIGRSGQPTQNPGGRAGKPARSPGSLLLQRKNRLNALRAIEKLETPFSTTSPVYSPASGSTSLPLTLTLLAPVLRSAASTASSM